MDLHDIIVELGKRGIPFDQLLTIPEQDNWVYSTTTVNQQVLVLFFQCIEAGIFGPVSGSIQVTEFTISHDAPLLIAPLFFGYNCYFFPNCFRMI